MKGAPGGAAVYTGDEIEEWKGDFLIGALGARQLQRVRLDARGQYAFNEVYFEGDPPRGFGRLREVVMGPDGSLYVTTSNCDGRGICPSDGDKVLRVVPE